jgi:hypothetical protein
MFSAAGACKPIGWEDISEGILSQLDRDPLKGEKPIFLSFDTNALRRRYYTLISNLVKHRNSRDRNRPIKAGFVVSRGVLKELEGFDRKYREDDIHAMAAARSIKDDSLKEFFNKLKLEERLVRLGFVEYRKMSRREYFFEVEGEPGDRAILDALEQFCKGSTRDVLVLSEDSDFVERANSRRLKGVRLDLPKVIPSSIDVDWETIAQLLYVAAITFGAISIRGGVTAKLFGIWSGKKAEHWNSETLRIETSSPRLEEFLRASQRVLPLS